MYPLIMSILKKREKTVVFQWVRRPENPSYFRGPPVHLQKALSFQYVNGGAFFGSWAGPGHSIPLGP